MPRPVRTLATLLLAGALLGAAATAPVAATEQTGRYRFWSYWWGADGQWTFARAGASHAVADGDVEGWRFGLGDSSGAEQPREAASFDALCGHVPRPDGSVRVALVVDFGDPADAPDGESPPSGVDSRCVVVPEAQATGIAVLAESSTVRQRSGLICGIGGFPQRDCAPRVTVDAAPAAPSGWDTELPAVAGLVLVLGLGGVAVHRWRRPAAVAVLDGGGHG